MRRDRPPRSPAQKLVLFLAAIAAIYGGIFAGNWYQQRTAEPAALIRLEQPRALSDFTLSDQNGTPFDPQRLQERWSLLFAGYTRSDEETHAVLSLVSRVYNRLADVPPVQQAVQMVFLSVDPQYDTVERLHGFIGLYHERFVAVTGDDAELRKLALQLGLIYRREGLPDGDYRIDHSTYLALINPRGELIGVFTGLLDPATIADDLKILFHQWPTP